MEIITGHLQTYPWGVEGGLNRWLPSPAGSMPQAELWFGAHPNGPSPLRDRAGTLADAVDAEHVPLLVKLLAAEHPLSIQIHPPAEMAAALHEADSPLVSDPWAKNEMLVALEPFAVFAGWRDPDEAADILSHTSPALVSVAADVRSRAYDAAIRALLDLPTEDVPELVSHLLDALAGRVGMDELRGYALTAETFPGDAGVLVAVLMNYRMLNAHDAVYMPAGGVHAYIQGFGLEVMTASDNVLRLGMTSKTIAVNEAMQAITPGCEPRILGGETTLSYGEPTLRHYRPTQAPFEVALVRSSAHSAPAGAYRCVVCLGGDVRIEVGQQSAYLTTGQAAVVLAEDADAVVVADGTAALVTARA